MCLIITGGKGGVPGKKAKKALEGLLVVYKTYRPDLLLGNNIPANASGDPQATPFSAVRKWDGKLIRAKIED